MPHTQTQDELRSEIILTIQKTPAEHPIYTILAEEIYKRIEPLILQDRERAYQQGYNDNARDCYCDSPGATEGVLPHRHLMTDETSSDIRPELSQLTANKEGK